MSDSDFKKELTRRSFIKAGAIGTGAVTLGLMGGPAFAQEPKPKKWDRTADVVIIGSGGAGLSAAVVAADKGSSVIVLEKMPTIGGNTMISGGFMNAADPERQGKQGITDSPENHFKQTLAAGDFRADPEKVKILTANALDAVHWLESLGMKFDDKVIQVYGALYPRSHVPKEPKGTGYIRVLKAACDKRKVNIQTQTKVAAIIREKQSSGRVLGIKALDRRNKTIYIKANRAVVLASGGFGANKELRALHDPRMRDLTTTNQPGSTGDLILAAMDIGGYPIGMDYIQCNPGAPPGRNLRITLHLDVSGFIFVDKRGKRFVAEDERRDVLREAILNLPEKYGYTVLDDEVFQGYDKITRDTTMAGIKEGDAWTANTLEELAAKMGVPPDEFVATVKRYNDVIVPQKKDPDFGKNPRNLTKVIAKPPFWACYAGMAVHHTMGGLNINTKAQVLDHERKVIPGLYAAGEVTGGIHGTNRVGGNAIADIFVFGRIAGANAAAEKGGKS